MIKVAKLYTEKRIPQKNLMLVLDAVLKKFSIEKKKINLIFVNDKYIRELNKKFLGHKGTTDVIAFPFDSDDLFGEIYVCVDTVMKQAKKYKTTYTDELIRVSVHGLLHLVGYDDNTEKRAMEMHRLEDKFLNLKDTKNKLC